MTNKNGNGKNHNDDTNPPSDRYTIFHALFEALKDKDKDKKHKRR